MEPFAATTCIEFGWRTFTKRPGFFIGAGIVFGVIVWALGAILGQVGQVGHGLNIVTFLLNIVVQTFASMGTAHFYLKAHDDPHAVSLNDLWYPTPFWNFLGAMILYFIIVALGFVAFIVPGIILLIMFGFYQYLIVEQNAKPLEALRESKRITTGYKWELFMLGILVVLLILLGLLCLFVGIFVAMPVTTLAIVHAYRTLRGQMLPAATTS